mgnify:CR=1 FL=1
MTKIILINGKKRSGKDFYASHIVQKLKEQEKSVEIMSFADPLKEIICNTFDISLETFNDYKNEKTKLYTQRKKLTGYDYDMVTDFRTLIQRLGTEGIKPIFGDWSASSARRYPVKDLVVDLIVDFVTRWKSSGEVSRFTWASTSFLNS